MLKASKAFMIFAVFAMLFVGMTNQPATGAASITCPAEVRIGNLLSCKITGLTVGTNYWLDAQHSDANVSTVITAASTTEYARFTMTTADSNGIVPVSVSVATSTPSAGTTVDTALVNLINPGSDIPSAFFQNLLAPVLIIGIFVLLMSAFFIKRRMK
jgi:hypothetical protein